MFIFLYKITALYFETLFVIPLELINCSYLLKHLLKITLLYVRNLKRRSYITNIVLCYKLTLSNIYVSKTA